MLGDGLGDLWDPSPPLTPMDPQFDEIHHTPGNPLQIYPTPTPTS